MFYLTALLEGDYGLPRKTVGGGAVAVSITKAGRPLYRPDEQTFQTWTNQFETVYNGIALYAIDLGAMGLQGTTVRVVHEGWVAEFWASIDPKDRWDMTTYSQEQARIVTECAKHEPGSAEFNRLMSELNYLGARMNSALLYKAEQEEEYKDKLHKRVFRIELPFECELETYRIFPQGDVYRVDLVKKVHKKYVGAVGFSPAK